MPAGRQHVLVRDGPRNLQFVADGASMLEPVRLHTDALVDARSLRQRLAALEALNAVVQEGRLLADLYAADPRSRRLRQVLQALDGWLAGATYRQIGIALFGEKRVTTDWSDPRHHLFNRVRRAVHRGRSLMTGGYRLFLT
ncbi:MAG: DUF2285 domain-containing protein [Rhodospirillales bacterium]|nr:DUF2285 domain-containing protein [Rhodospirillales bacterium]